MILKSIRLKNFRCFKDTGVIELKPITILVGANSSGKSSFLRFFPLLKNSCKQRDLDGVFDWGKNDSDYDFESFDNTVTAGESEMFVEYNFNQSINKNSDNYDFTIQHSIQKSGDSEKITNLSIVSRNTNETFVLTTNHNYYNCQNYNISDLEGYKGLDFGFVEPITRTNTFLPDLQINGRNFYDLIQRERNSEALTNMRFLFETASKEFKNFADNINYVKPLRLDINRTYSSSSSSELKSDGSNLSEFLKKLSDTEFDSLNVWLKKYLGDKLYIQIDREKVLDREIYLLEIRDGKIVLDNKDKPQRRNMVDLGFGYSQLLPILVMIWNVVRKDDDSNEYSRIILIEQPEVHLHPKFQGKFAEILCNISNENKNLIFVVETHSELIINKIGSIIVDDIIDSNDISVFIFNKENKVSSIEEHTFEPEGYLNNWPIDFFDEE